MELVEENKTQIAAYAPFYAQLQELECFGGIMKMREAFSALPEWFPLPTEPNSLDEI